MPFKLAPAPAGFSITPELSTPKNLYEPTTGESEEAWVRFIGHLLRNTLNPVISYLNILNDKQDSATEYNEAIEHIYNGLHNLTVGLNSLQAHLTKRSTTFSTAVTEAAGAGGAVPNPASPEQGILNFIQPFEADVMKMSLQLNEIWIGMHTAASDLITVAIHENFAVRLRVMAQIANNMMAKLPYDLEGTMAVARTPTPTQRAYVASPASDTSAALAPLSSEPRSDTPTLVPGVPARLPSAASGQGFSTEPGLRIG